MKQVLALVHEKAEDIDALRSRVESLERQIAQLDRAELGLRRVQ